MNQEFIKKFMQIYSKSLFPAKGYNSNEVVQKLSNATKDELDVVVKIPFAKPIIAQLLSLFGCELLYVWDKFLLKMQIIKMVFLFGFIGLISVAVASSSVLVTITSFLLIAAYFIIQLSIIVKISKITRTYNCDMLITALDSTKRNSIGYKLLAFRTKFFEFIKDKRVREIAKVLKNGYDEISSTFEVN